MNPAVETAQARRSHARLIGAYWLEQASPDLPDECHCGTATDPSGTCRCGTACEPTGTCRCGPAREPTGTCGCGPAREPTSACRCGPVRSDYRAPRPTVLWGATFALAASAISLATALALWGR